MKMGRVLIVALAWSTLVSTRLAWADFSYTQTRKSSQGPGAAGGDQVTKHYLKGQKMKVDSGRTASIFDFDAQTMTMLDTQAKTYTVTPFAELGQGLAKADVSAKIDVKETGQKKNVNGVNCNEVVMTVAMEGGPAAAQGMKMQMEMDMWLSSEVPGASELRAFYQKNGSRFPWAALGGGNPGMQKAIADMQKAIANQGGVPVLQITRMKSAGNEQMNAQMAQARARIEEMKKAGGQQAAMADQMLARMGGMGGGGGALFEMTMESSGFSTSSIPDSVFAIPADYKLVTK
jgi:Domain of unknown function (DUF4412)